MYSVPKYPDYPYLNPIQILFLILKKCGYKKVIIKNFRYNINIVKSLDQ